MAVDRMRSLTPGQNVLVKPVVHVANGSSCRAEVQGDEYVAARVVTVSDDGQSATVEYMEYSADPCSCRPERQTWNYYFLGELVTGG